MPTKLEEEINGSKVMALNAITTLKINIQTHAPQWLVSAITVVLLHPGTPWFFLGAGFEALGLSVVFLLNGSAYPIMDAIVSLIIGYGMLYYAKRKP